MFNEKFPDNISLISKSELNRIDTDEENKLNVVLSAQEGPKTLVSEHALDNIISYSYTFLSMNYRFFEDTILYDIRM